MTTPRYKIVRAERSLSKAVEATTTERDAAIINAIAAGVSIPRCAYLADISADLVREVLAAAGGE